MAPRFYNKNGTLTRYSFMCGYLEVYGDWLGGEGVRLGAESDSYHVTGFHTVEGETVRIWECFESVVEARRFARTIGKFAPASDAFSGK